MEIIDFIIIAGLILYVVPLLFRIVTRMLLQRLVSKAQQQGQQHFRQQSNSRPADGRVRVDYAPKVKSQIPDSEGDFIDYEEIK
ncbi:hypothetical protein BEL04_20440 [Mucilaginibacter sp. PPCGB 2223]|nr:hypothetical protein [Mucilaginibacter sp. PPCGB 2223]OCX51086.1 hypothetical protein BEL04_20440 [Mucilaginibacter sp. PPCGB 2223]